MRLTGPAVAAAAALAFALVNAPAAPAHGGNPHFETVVRQVTPTSAGIDIQVLNRDDRLLLLNESGKDVVIAGYAREPYARVLADGTVQVNTNSPAYYLNDDRYANVKVPAGIDGKDPTRWKEVGKSGRFEWHDHRMHWMAKSTPPQVHDENVKTKVFDWTIPVQIDGAPGNIAGTLYWTPLPGGGAPLGAIFGGAAIVIVLCIAVMVVRRRRAERAQAGVSGAKEAW
jgi:hypothetical protein